MTVNLHGRRVSITPEDFVMQNTENDLDIVVSNSFIMHNWIVDAIISSIIQLSR